MKSGKVSQFHGSPAVSTTSGMSSTPSISSTSIFRCSGRQGAKPTPQLPISAVVTPFHDVGVMWFPQVTCAS